MSVTPEQVEGLKVLVNVIDTNIALLKQGMFAGQLSNHIGNVLNWLEAYKEQVKAQIPVTPVPFKATVTEAPANDNLAEPTRAEVA